MSPTTTNNEAWSRIYSAASVISEMQPWEWMDEVDIFGIRIPGTDRIYFISVMGALGEAKAIAAYTGTRALGMFWELRDERRFYPPSSMAAATRVLSIPHLQLEFLEEEEMEPEEKEKIKERGGRKSKDGLWPLLEQYVPGFQQGDPDKVALEDAAVIFEQCSAVFDRTSEDADYTYSQDDNENIYLMRLKKDGPEGEWHDVFKEVWIEPSEYKIRYPSISLVMVKKYSKRQETLQIDIVILPMPVKDDEDGAYYPFMFLMVNKKTGIIEDYRILNPLPDIDTMYESLPEKLLDMFLDSHFVPQQVEIRYGDLVKLLKELLKKAGIKLIIPDRMEAMDEAIEGIVENMRKS